MNNQELDFYQKLRVKIKDWLQTEEGKDNKWAEYILCAPDLFHLLCKLAVDKDVLVNDKAKLAGAIAYFIFPVDIIPEAIIGPLGYVDDLAVAAYVLNGILSHTDPDIIRKHWAGEEEVLEVVQRIVEVADQMVGKGLWEKIKRRFS
ncbi:MAG: DUF1232 domain-containing protein [Syntrophomonas sp.]